MTGLIPEIPDDYDMQVEKAEEIASNVPEKIGSLEEYLVAGEVYLKMSAAIRGVKEAFAPIKKKYDDLHKETVKQEKRQTVPLEAAKKLIKSKMFAWDELQRVKALKKEEVTGVAALPPQIPKVVGFRSRTMYDFEILDIDKIPREFLMADEKKIRKYGEAMRETARIPGVRFFPKQV